MEHEALLADPRVDVVCIARPDRLHAPQTIDALKAGKDVYCEKPLTHWSQFELAKQIEATANETGGWSRSGTQHMADDNYPEIIRLIHEGIIGKPVHVECSYFRRGDWGERMPIPDPNAQPGPDLIWERFLGDAPKVDFSVSRFFQWRMYWDYAGGPATDLLVHTFTPVFCILELDFPERVLGGGGNFQYDREVPDQCNIIADYPGGPSVVMMNSLSNHIAGRHRHPRHRRGDHLGHAAGRQGVRRAHRAVRQGQAGNPAALEGAGRHGQAVARPAGLREDTPAAEVQHRDGRPRAGAAVDGHPLAPREQGGHVRSGETVDRALSGTGLAGGWAAPRAAWISEHASSQRGPAGIRELM